MIYRCVRAARGTSSKLAPFKLRFFKSSKSRSSESQDGSVTSQEVAGGLQPPELSSSQLGQLGSSESVESAGECARMLAAGADAGSVVSADTDSTMPASSPPPSYERVLEETKIAKMTEDEEAIEESTDEGKTVNRPPSKSRSKKSAAAATAAAATTDTIMPYKSSKEFYKAMAKQWGITCKMSDTCRCLDCQSRYFECSYDKYQDYDTYQEQSDGGLSASTPMFVSEIMHGSTCLLL